MRRIAIPRLACKRCGHRWAPTQSIVRICPRCKSTGWGNPPHLAAGPQAGDDDEEGEEAVNENGGTLITTDVITHTKERTSS